MTKKKEQLLALATDYVTVATDFINGKIDETIFRRVINHLALKERLIPYETEFQKYIVGEESFKILLKEIVVNEVDCFIAKINTILPNRGTLTNAYLKDFIYDLVIKECRINIKTHTKIHIRITQFIKPTRTGKLPKDADNNEKKGVIDGIAEGFGIDDNADYISYSSDIKCLKKGEEPYTMIFIVPDKDVDNFFENHYNVKMSGSEPLERGEAISD